MKIHVNVATDRATTHEFARVELKAPGLDPSVLDLDCPSLKPFGAVQGPGLDFLYFATAVYGVDKLVPRSSARNNWERQLEVYLPINNAEIWKSVADALAECVSFLTGDRWAFHFSELSATLFRPEQKKPKRALVAPPETQAVCLFSGGLDSLVGAIDWLESNPGANLTLAGHHDRRVPGPLGDQERLIDVLKPAYPNRIRTLLTRVGQDPPGGEITLRSRSILFIALGAYAAAALGNTPLLIPENGTIALNVPLTPSRRGSCSTRTAHPFYLQSLQAILPRLGLPISISNPLGFKTKGEAVSQCLNGALLKQLAPFSASCAKRGHTRTWVNKSARNCGRCMPCIYRRAALNLVDLDTETYGVDVCTGDVDIDDSEHEAPNDFRACLSFLRQGIGADGMASLLMASGRLPIRELPDYASVVLRAMDEIRKLLRDKGSDEIKRRAAIR